MIGADFEDVRVTGLQRLTKSERRRIGGKGGVKMRVAIILKVKATDTHKRVVGQLFQSVVGMQIIKVGGRISS